MDKIEKLDTFQKMCTRKLNSGITNGTFLKYFPFLQNRSKCSGNRSAASQVWRYEIRNGELIYILWTNYSNSDLTAEEINSSYINILKNFRKMLKDKSWKWYDTYHLGKKKVNGKDVLVPFLSKKLKSGHYEDEFDLSIEDITNLIKELK